MNAGNRENGSEFKNQKFANNNDLNTILKCSNIFKKIKEDSVNISETLLLENRNR